CLYIPGKILPLFQIKLKINESRMKLTVLNENVAGNNCSAEHGLSCFFLVKRQTTFFYFYRIQNYHSIIIVRSCQR
ncbi:MAG: hypothetical protein KAT40_04595, partial [Bacteroidales bacterium]|nr:hypothetical protein [Bacteroidales bacterium]